MIQNHRWQNGFSGRYKNSHAHPRTSLVKKIILLASHKNETGRVGFRYPPSLQAQHRQLPQAPSQRQSTDYAGPKQIHKVLGPGCNEIQEHRRRAGKAVHWQGINTTNVINHQIWQLLTCNIQGAHNQARASSSYPEAMQRWYEETNNEAPWNAIDYFQESSHANGSDKGGEKTGTNDATAGSQTSTKGK